MSGIAEAYGPSEESLRLDKAEARQAKRKRLAKMDEDYSALNPKVIVEFRDGKRIENRGFVPCGSGSNPMWTSICNARR